MFNNLLAPVTFYIILGLSVSTMGFGYLSYSLSNDKAVAVYALKESQETIAGYQKSLNLAYLSCKQDDKDTVDLEADKGVLKDKVDQLTAQISKLKSGVKRPVLGAPVKTGSAPLNINNTEAPKNAEATTILDGTELLSDDLVRMLHSSYCIVEDCSSVSTR